ncbi:methylthioribose-1-phosphate isomerase-like [Watersipora subatra]|uniref:methylthioribose-1-phosphate isomerase-like n=1 Tax=Watersipora subatra TaxID=2589382 RepID=UPI00355C6C42
MLEAIKYSPDSGLHILDQLLLPKSSEYIKLCNIDDGFKAIKTMQVRGAPAIAIVGMLSLAEELKSLSFTCSDEMISRMSQRLSYLCTSRPTAVNLSNASQQVLTLARDNRDLPVSELRMKVVNFAIDMLKKDVDDNKAIGQFGAEAIAKICATKRVRILTHCNTGSLATAGYGTALGVIRSLHKKGSLEMAYCTETRPYNQGSRLTAYELVYDGIPSNLVCDSMVALLLQKKSISAIVVGADRVAANGDTANKIGTFQLAIMAQYFNVPFYVAAPLTSVDFKLNSGDGIVIEQRPEEELACIGGVRIAAEGISCWNPAFDVTPAALITAIITEKGAVAPGNLLTLKT